jgi:ABC-type polar amino acid transport system ATPase subunit
MEAVYKYYGEFTALNEIDLKVAGGEKIVICGPSGSGKSTLIRCINHIEKHDQRLIYVNGTELDDQRKNIDAIRRDTGMVFQSFNLFPHMTTLENCILAPMTVNGMAKDEAKDLAMHFLTKVRIPEQAEKFPGAVVGRTAAARRYRACALHAAKNHAVRRADVGARSGDGQGRAGDDEEAGRGGHDHALRHA